MSFLSKSRLPTSREVKRFSTGWKSIHAGLNRFRPGENYFHPGFNRFRQGENYFHPGGNPGKTYKAQKDKTFRGSPRVVFKLPYPVHLQTYLKYRYCI